MNAITGDLLALARTGRFDLIVHGCNCFCSMEAGIARTIAQRFPSAYQADRATARGDRAKLGTYSSARIESPRGDFVVVNAYTQFHYAGPGPQVDYLAIEQVMRRLAADFDGQRIGYPKLGAGLAGGDWPRIAVIIAEALVGQDHALVVLPS